MLSSCMCRFSLDTPVSSCSPKSCFIGYLLTLNCPKDVNMSGYICDGLASHPGYTPPLTNSGWRPWKGLNGLTRQMDGWKWALKFTGGFESHTMHSQNVSLAVIVNTLSWLTLCGELCLFNVFFSHSTFVLGVSVCLLFGFFRWNKAGRYWYCEDVNEANVSNV